MSLDQLAEQVARTVEAVDRSDAEVKAARERMKQPRHGDPLVKH